MGFARLKTKVVYVFICWVVLLEDDPVRRWCSWLRGDCRSPSIGPGVPVGRRRERAYSVSSSSKNPSTPFMPGTMLEGHDVGTVDGALKPPCPCMLTAARRPGMFLQTPLLSG